MAIIIGSDEAGKQLKEVIKSYLLDNKYDVVDVTEEDRKLTLLMQLWLS